MKTCPICKSRCFDDMAVCYGCLHRFDEETAGSRVCASGVSGACEPIDLPADEVRAVSRGDGESFCAQAGDRLPVEGGGAGKVTATVRPSRGQHGALVVRIEIPASILKESRRVDAEATIEPAMA